MALQLKKTRKHILSYSFFRLVPKINAINELLESSAIPVCAGRVDRKVEIRVG